MTGPNAPIVWACEQITMLAAFREDRTGFWR